MIEKRGAKSPTRHNSRDQLEFIAQTYYPRLWDAYVASKFDPSALDRLKLKRAPAEGRTRITGVKCDQCGGGQFAQYAPSTGAIQCVDCRKVFFPRAADAEETAAIMDMINAALGRPAVGGKKEAKTESPPLETRLLQCYAPCRNNREQHCVLSRIKIGDGGACMAFQPREAP